MLTYSGQIREQILEMDELIANGEIPSSESYELGKIRTELNAAYNGITELYVIMREDPFVAAPYEVGFED